MQPNNKTHATGRQLLYSKDAQPFLIAGSGTLGWDQACSLINFEGATVFMALVGLSKSRRTRRERARSA